MEEYNKVNIEKLVSKADTFQFIRILAGSTQGKNNFTAIQTKSKTVKDFTGSIDELYDTLLQLNKQGYCIFMVVNECNGPRKTENVTRVRSNFFDDDSNSVAEIPLEPSMVVQSARGKHGYFLIEGDYQLQKFSHLQKAISEKLGTDPVVSDLPRLMRVPGFVHMKDPTTPKEVKLLSTANVKYTIEKIKEAFQFKEVPEVANAQMWSNSDGAGSEDFLDWVNELPAEEGPANKYGGRNKTALILVREGYGRKINKELIHNALKVYCTRSNLHLEEVESMLNRQAHEDSVKNFKAFFAKKNNESIAPSRLTEKFLKECNYITLEGVPMIVYWRGEYLIYSSNCYKKISTSELRSKIINFFRNDPLLKDKWTRSKTEEILIHLQGVNPINANINSGTMLSRPDEKNHLIFTKDKILKLCPEKQWQIEEMHHDADYFSQVVLPYGYDVKAECTLFLNFLNQVLPDEDTRQFIQEWFGYNLIHDVSQGKFVVLMGDGANGKSVLLTVLTALVGKDNVSGVPLECFNAVRTFPIAATIGKLSNICDEMGMLKGVEATLKQFVSGLAMNIEKKGKDGFEQNPTARLTFATNNLPNFQDRSEGLWRRLIAIPMSVQVLDEAKQDKRLGQLEFWQQSNEMPGVLNWAIIGLQRLMHRGHFNEPEVSKRFKKSYRVEADVVTNFFESRLEVCEQGSIGSTTLYSEYITYSKQLESHPVSHSVFNRCIKKRFAAATLSENALNNIDGKRQRAWSGIKLIGMGY